MDKGLILTKLRELAEKITVNGTSVEGSSDVMKQAADDTDDLVKESNTDGGYSK